MSTMRGKCTNFGNCVKADSGEFIDVRAEANPVCPICNKSLTIVGAAASRRPPTAGLLAGVIIVVLLALFIVIFHKAGTPGQNVFGGQQSGGDCPDCILNRPLRVGVVTWPGYAGGIVANNGFAPNKNCIFYNNHKLEVEFVLMEDVDARAKAFAKGGPDGVDIVWSTVDFWANELPGFQKGGVDSKAIMQVDWSRGGDAIVADDSIQKVEDLKGKKIALALFTPSHWLLENSLENSSLDDSDQSDIMKNVVGKNASPDARADFEAHKVDAAVVWEPDVTEALKNRPGSHILISSKTAANLIADIMVAKTDFINAHPDVIKAFVAGWFDGTVEANRHPDEAAQLLAENEPLYKDLGVTATQDQLGAVKWADMTDNVQMFGLDGKEPLFDRIFARASSAWIKRDYITQSTTAADAKDVTALRSLYTDLPQDARPMPQQTDAGVSSEGKRLVVFSTKPINIYFPSNKATLDDNAKSVLDGVATTALTYSHAFIRVEGNSASTGHAAGEVLLSKWRAQAVVSYLVNRYGLNRGRFQARGNGPYKPVAPNNTEAGQAKNRRTDIVLLKQED
ncbi:MAG: phosphate ABC transporter substrate-binding/OmpA family protein [Capsulimonadaceae bacterium]